MGELLARVRAMLRRREEYQPDLRTFGDLSLDSGSSELRCGSQKVILPKVEYQMMDVLMLNHGIYLSSEDLLEKVWGYDTEADVGAVWVYISYLRKRIQTVGSSVKITAKRNIGYTLTY
jgi:DNA-binding response OmpR family regulator